MLLDIGDGLGGDTNINLDKYFYFPENNSDFTAGSYKISLPTPTQPPPPPSQTAWLDYSAVQSGSNTSTASSLVLHDVPPLTEIKKEKPFDDEEDIFELEEVPVPVWHTAKSTSKITMYPRQGRLQSIQPKPVQPMPPLAQIRPASKTIISIKKIQPIQPKPIIETLKSEQPVITNKLVIKKVSHFSMNTRRNSTGNHAKIIPTKELLDSLKTENIIYQDNVDKPWICKSCGRQYKWKNSLKCHIKNECGVPPKYHCSRKCGYKTHIHSNLKRHLNSKFCKPTSEQDGETTSS